MSVARVRQRSRSRRREVLQKPSGVIHPRVQKVGPEHFGGTGVPSAGPEPLPRGPAGEPRSQQDGR